MRRDLVGQGPGGGVLEAARAGSLPRLVTLADVKGDFHNHSVHTDGRQTLEEMAEVHRAVDVPIAVTSAASGAVGSRAVMDK